MANTEYLAQERAAKVVWLLAKGARLSSRQVAALTGLTRNSARELLNLMSRVCPIYRDANGCWRECSDR